MKGWLLGCIGVLWVQAAKGQGSQGVRLGFQFSRVVLSTGDTLTGPVSMQQEPDLLYMARPDGSVRVLVPAAVAAFAVQGEGTATTEVAARQLPRRDPTEVRLFRTINSPAHRPDLRPEPLFFEQLSDGPVLLLRRQHIVPHLITPKLAGAGPSYGPTRALVPLSSGKTPPPPPPNSRPLQFQTVNHVDDVFYLAFATGEVRQLHHPRKDLLAAYPAQARQLQAYAQAQHLTYTGAAELHQLVSYANSLLPAVAP